MIQCWSAKRFVTVTVVVVLLLPIIVSGKYNLTLAVAEPGTADDWTMMEKTKISLDNGSFDVTVFWSVIDPHNTFLVTQYLESLAKQNADLLILSNELRTVVEESSQMVSQIPQVVTYFQEDPRAEGGGEAVQDGSLCRIRGSLKSPSSQESLAKPCDGLGTAFSRVDTLIPVISRLRWNQLVIIFDEENEMAGKDLSDRLTHLEIQTQIWSYNVSDFVPQDGGPSGSSQGRSLHEVMQSLFSRHKKHSGELRVVLLCSVQCTKQVLAAASQFDALNDKRTAMALISRWLLLLPPRDQHFLESCDLQLDNMAVIVHPPEALLSPVSNIRKDLTSIVETAYNQLLNSNDTLTPGNLTQAIIKSIQAPQLCYRGYVRTLLWKPEGRRLSDVGYVGQDKKLHMAVDQEVFPNIKFGLNNRKFVVATLPWPSFVERRGNGTYVGLCVDLLHQLQFTLNFSFQWVEPADQQWGMMTANNTWTGLVGMLERKEVDMVMAPISVQADREQVMDFTYPFYIDYTTVLLKLPDPDDSKWKRLIQPFHRQVHMYIWISLLSVTVVTFLLELVNPFYLTNTKAMLHIGDMFWYMFGALLTQGGARLPDSQTGRTMVSAFWLFSIIMAAIYSGNLIAFLTVSIDSAPFDTLRGLVEQDQYTWGTLGGTFYQSLFKESNIEVFRKVWQGLERERGSDPDVFSGDPKKHLEKVKAGGYAYIGDKSAVSTWLKTECDLITITEEFLPLQYAIGLVNNSDYTTLFSNELLEINEIGLMETWIRNWWSKTSFCQGTLTASSTPIQLIDVQSAFYLVFIGITFSLLVLLLEKVTHRFHLLSRVKHAFSKNAEGRARTEASAWNSSCIFSDGNTVTHIKTENRPAERPLGREFQTRTLFYLETPRATRAAANGGVASEGPPAGYEDSGREFTYSGWDTRVDLPLPNGGRNSSDSVGYYDGRTRYSHCNGGAHSAKRMVNGVGTRASNARTDS